MLHNAFHHVGKRNKKSCPGKWRGGKKGKKGSKHSEKQKWEVKSQKYSSPHSTVFHMVGWNPSLGCSEASLCVIVINSPLKCCLPVDNCIKVLKGNKSHSDHLRIPLGVYASTSLTSGLVMSCALAFWMRTVKTFD